jgi:hypothetical protein
MGGSEFSVLTTAKWIFDAESEKLRADFFKHAENTKIMVEVCDKSVT